VRSRRRRFSASCSARSPPPWHSSPANALRAAADLGDLAAGALAVELSITVGAEFADRYAAASALPAQSGVERWTGPAGTQRLACETLAPPGEDEHRVVVLLPV
jgi:hypothetical protein